MLVALAASTLLLSAVPEGDEGDLDRKLFLLGQYPALLHRGQTELAARLLTLKILQAIETGLPFRGLTHPVSGLSEAVVVATRDLGKLSSYDRFGFEVEISASFVGGAERDRPIWVLMKFRPLLTICSWSKEFTSSDFSVALATPESAKIEAQGFYEEIRKLILRVDRSLEDLAWLRDHPDNAKPIANHLMKHMDWIEKLYESKMVRYLANDESFLVFGQELLRLLGGVSVDSELRDLFETWTMALDEHVDRLSQGYREQLWSSTKDKLQWVLR